MGSYVLVFSTAAVIPGNGFPMEPGLTGIPLKLVITIQPVSVCQKVSWKGLPNASCDQRTASALSGSPTLARWRRLEWSCRRTTSVPSFISNRIAVGAEYQTVIRCFSMNSYHRSALKPESSTTCVVPFDHSPSRSEEHTSELQSLR